MRFNQLSEFDQNLGPRSTSLPLPCRICSECSADGLLDILFVTLCELSANFAVPGIEGGERFAARGRHEFAIDEGAPGFRLELRDCLRLGLVHGTPLSFAIVD